MTVEQLKQALISMQQTGKSDDDVSARLKQIELCEEMTYSTKVSLQPCLPGPLSIEHMSILHGRGAFLPPPASGVPDTAAPDAAAQKDILAKAADYVTKSYAQNPPLTASKTTSRFQDHVLNSSSSPGLVVKGPNTYAQMQNARVEPVEIEKGNEKPAAKDKTSWGQNGLISEPAPAPALSIMLQEALAGGKVNWLRWQTIDGKPAAVFSFEVEKKKSHYDVSYCCFPKTETQTGIAAPGGFQPVTGQIQSLTTWRPFKKTVGYHGELYVSPENGTVLRVIAHAELKPTDVVHQENRHMDHSAVVIDGKEYVLPLDSFTENEVVPVGDSDNSNSYSVQHTLFNVTYTNYR